MKQYRNLLVLWFMRDLTDEQRRPLFRMLSGRYPETRDEQQREFSRILSVGAAEALALGLEAQRLADPTLPHLLAEPASPMREA
jgi:hypothetical protein